MEQRFAVALANKQGLKVSDLPTSDLIELSYRFYRDTWEKLPDFDTLLPEAEGPIANNYFTLALASRAESIGLVFEAKLKVLKDGMYTFDLESTEGARLIVDGHAVLDQPNKGKQTASKKIALRAGLLPVRLEYFNTYDKPQLKIEWSGPGVERRLLTDAGDKEKVDLAALIKSHGAEALGEKEKQEYLKSIEELGRAVKQSRPKSASRYPASSKAAPRRPICSSAEIPRPKATSSNLATRRC